MKLSISKKIMALVIVPIVLVVLVSSVGSSILLGSKLMHETEARLKLSVYAMQKETEQMSAANTKAATVNDLLSDFKESNDIDITIFGGNVRMFSTVPGALGTEMDSSIWEAIKGGDDYFSKNANVNGEKYYAYYAPVINNGECVGAFFAGQPTKMVDLMIIENMLKILAISVITGVIFIITGLFVVRKIVCKLELLRQILSTLAANDLTREYPKYIHVRDEIEEISNNAVDFTKQLRGIVGSVIDESKALNTVSSELEEGMNGAYGSVEGVTNAIQNIAEGAEGQSQDTQDITQQVEGIGRNIDDIRESMNLLTDAAARMLEVEKETLSSVEQAIEDNNKIKSDIEEVNEQIDVTNKSMESIGSFVDVIKDIASQTNLLSLNASIEAAHAGEQGKGFAVVADEIRKLSEQSTAAATNVDKIISELTGNFDIIIQRTAITASSIENQSKQMNDTKEAFAALDNGIKETVEQIEVVTLASNELEEMKNRVVDAVCSLSAISEENSASTEETSAAVEELNEVIAKATDNAKEVDMRAKALGECVDVFKI